MKTMICSQLGGACEIAFQAETFEEMAQLSQSHGAEMFQRGDEAHLTAMQKMKEKMADPKSMQDWMDAKRHEFDALPEDK